MPGDDYGYVTGGGLRLKGSKVSKARKKKSSKKTQTSDDSGHREQSAKSITPSSNENEGSRSISPTPASNKSSNLENDNNQRLTASERKFLEIQKVRLEKRLKEKGVKSHEQLVEEYNSYLSRLSEHHDMPKIGPG